MCQVCVRTHVTYVCGFEPPHLLLGDAREGHTSYLYKPIPIIVFIELVCIMAFLYYVCSVSCIRAGIYRGIVPQEATCVLCFV